MILIFFKQNFLWSHTTLSSGYVASTETNSIYLANPSFSHISFHHSMVTRFPNHCVNERMNHWKMQHLTTDICPPCDICLPTYCCLCPMSLSLFFTLIVFQKCDVVQQTNLMGQLMSNHHGNPELVGGRWGGGVKEQSGLPVSVQTPVLHRPRLKVWYGNQI